MRYIYSLLAFALAVTFSSCTTKIEPAGPWVKKIDSEELSRLVINYSAEMKRVHQLVLEDSYAAYDDDIKRICLRYSSQRLLSIKEARMLIVDMVEGFLDRINNHSVLSFELENYPFTANNIDIRINFESYFGHYVDPLYIGMIWLQAGCVHFYAFDRKDIRADWDHHRFEPYSKSRELALLTKEADMPPYAKENPPKSPSSYIYNRYTPYKPYAPYAPSVHYPPNPPYYPNLRPYGGAFPPGPSVPISTPVTISSAVPNPSGFSPAVPVRPSNPGTIYTSSNASDLPPYNPNVPANAIGERNLNYYSDLPAYNPNLPADSVRAPITSDLAPYNPNVPADTQAQYNPHFYSDIPAYVPTAPAY